MDRDSPGRGSSISDYGLLSDCQGAALLARDGSVDWWCPARFDAPSVFGRLLDPKAGHWSIRPLQEQARTWRYVPGTMVLETEVATSSGRVRMTDALLLGPEEHGHRIGFRSPHALARRVDALEGHVDLHVELAPRPEYGLLTPRFSPVGADLEIAAGADRLTLRGSHPLRVAPGVARAEVRLAKGEAARFVLRHRTSIEDLNDPPDDGASIERTIASWRSWSDEHRGYDGLAAERVRRSALVLQALTYQPTGAVAAAATTSLPEKLGGGANWDYRYGWLRDGSLTLNALWVAACPDEADRFFTWMTSSAGLDLAEGLPVMFGLGGENDLTEHELGHLAGFADSRPVRIGNDAWKQKQLDVLGEVLECAFILRDTIGDLAPDVRTLLRETADRAARLWPETDSGIWEGREGERHYLSSKLMCWVALDRAVKLAEHLGPEADVGLWTSERDRLREAILVRGWNDEKQAFTGAFDSDHLDAAVLLMPMVGFLPADDERVLATIATIERELSDGVLVQRWTGSGDEGAFVICSYWLSTAYALCGRVDRAVEIFEAVTGYSNDLGLLAEEIDPRSGRFLGNFPQALSHIGLINAAWAITQARETEPGS